MDIKKNIERYWNSYKSVAPNNFPSKLQKEFHQRWWELYCGVALINSGITLISNNRDEGPDYKFRQNNRNYYIEAIAPTLGDKKRIKPIQEGVVSLPEGEFLLRLTSALEEKLQKYQKYLQKDYIKSNDLLIIAISTCDLGQYGSLMDYPKPAITKVLFDIGCDYINLDTGEKKISSRGGVKKSDNIIIESNLFELERYKIISGVIYSNIDPLNTDKPDGILYFKNTNAYNLSDDLLFI
jgi:hypothetical protein